MNRALFRMSDDRKRKYMEKGVFKKEFQSFFFPREGNKS